jgi:integrase
VVAYPHLEKKRNVWFAKLGIPKEVRHVFKGRNGRPLTAFTRTTEETDPHRAFRVAAPILEYWRDEIAMARAQMPSNLMEEWTEHARRYVEMYPNIPYDVPGEDGEHERAVVLWLVGFITLGRNEAIDLLAYRTMPRVERDEVFRHEPKGEVVSREWADKQVAKADGGTPFLHHLEHFEKHASQVGGTLRQMLSTIQKFADAVPVDIEQLTGADVQQWLFDLMNEKHPEKPADQGTKVRKLYELRTYWTHLASMGWVPEDKACPFDNRKVANQETDSDAQERERATYKPAEIPALWKQAEADGDLSLAAVIKLAAYSGARLGEIMNLTRLHIFTEDDIPCIRIMKGKTPKAKRWFPIHPDIRDLVISLNRNADKDGYLIHSTAQHRSPAMSQRFGRMKTAMDYGPLYTEHSIRHAVIQMFREVRCPLEVRRMIVGHERGNERADQGADYGGLTPKGRLDWMMTAIVYP